jgi:serralysin
MAATSSVSKSGNYYTDGLLSGIKWGVSTLTFSFPSLSLLYEPAYGSGEPLNGFQAFNAAQQAAVRNALGQVGAVSNIAFKEVQESAILHADLRFAESNDPATAYAYGPSTRPEGGDAWFNNARGYYDNPVVGGYAFLTILHEIGHALGLKHAHEAAGPFAAMPSGGDRMEFTVMSYRSYQGASITSGYSNEDWGYAQSLMMHDIAAVQHMYGADYTTRSGATKYTWSPTTGEMFINGVGQGKPGGNQIFLTVWDGGGVDTYDLSNYSGNVRINLAPGAWTVTSTAQLAKLHYDGSKVAVGNVANALLHKGDLRSLIENATGGLGHDQIIGNQGANVLNGGAGRDLLVGAGGQDVLWGGSGADTFDFNAVAESVAGAARDVIRDFVAAMDLIDLATIDADQDGTAGNQAFLFIGAVAFSGVDGQLRFGRYDYAGTASDLTVVSADIDGNKVADFDIAVSGLHKLTAGDFIL